MLKDCENNEIFLMPRENNHIKVIGKSGSGKTYWACRYIEEMSCVVPILIVDFSGSYTEYELGKNKFRRNLTMKNFNVKKETLIIYVNPIDMADQITDALITTLNIESMMQKKLLKKNTEEILRRNGFFSFKFLFENMESAIIKTDAADRKSMEFLTSRLYHLKATDTFLVAARKNTCFSGINIIQLSDFPERIRKTLAQFFLEIIWREIQNNIPKYHLQIVLDEFQMLKLKGTAIEEMLREGRKYGVGMTMLTQYAPKCEDLDILEQTASSLYFAPNERNIISTAKMIEPQNHKVWVPILKHLEKGNCVLTGGYSINRKPIIAAKPLICKVK